MSDSTDTAIWPPCSVCGRENLNPSWLLDGRVYCGKCLPGGQSELIDLRALAGEIAKDSSLVARGLNVNTGVEYEVLHVPIGTWLRVQRWKRKTL